MRVRNKRGVELEGPGDIQRIALGISGPCVACHTEIAYFRRRQDNSIYVSQTCSVQEDLGCSRGGDASEAQESLIASIKTGVPLGQTVMNL